MMMKKTHSSKNEKTRFEKVNHLILVLHFIFPLWLLVLVYTSGISGVLFLVMLFAVLLLGAVYKIVQRIGKGKPVLLIARIAAFSAIVIYYLPFLIMVSFSKNQLFYPLKRYCYIHGVYYSQGEIYEELLPDSLPKNCSSYAFRTQGSMIAQDYHASSYLVFYTDIQTQKEYAEKYRQKDSAPLTRDSMIAESDAESDSESSYPDKKITWFINMMQLDAAIVNTMENFEFFFIPERYPKAVLLDYDTGLVAILT